ncbi:uncharacterized protein LOC129584210 [Paramacrobiotus metropolitanus]|uniref:uncharacterized protein LOC129584210 n=1 Tax=Paramacrobiotus metropolitanus TaxID=2943436 RepID=UPI0024464CA9|nr:uncharacterized protein LOC129584210 [Paramacrobiotus metropolitanus]
MNAMCLILTFAVVCASLIYAVELDSDNARITTYESADSPLWRCYSQYPFNAKYTYFYCKSMAMAMGKRMPYADLQKLSIPYTRTAWAPLGWLPLGQSYQHTADVDGEAGTSNQSGHR